MAKKKVVPHEDKKKHSQCCAIAPIEDEFINGDFICRCVECNTKFIGKEDSYFCAVCLNEFYLA